MRVESMKSPLVPLSPNPERLQEAFSDDDDSEAYMDDEADSHDEIEFDWRYQLHAEPDLRFSEEQGGSERRPDAEEVEGSCFKLRQTSIQGGDGVLEGRY
jgi:hypothetical protein